MMVKSKDKNRKKETNIECKGHIRGMKTELDDKSSPKLVKSEPTYCDLCEQDHSDGQCLDMYPITAFDIPSHMNNDITINGKNNKINNIIINVYDIDTIDIIDNQFNINTVSINGNGNKINNITVNIHNTNNRDMSKIMDIIVQQLSLITK